MRNKIAFMLATVMTASAFFVPTMASSKNSLSNSLDSIEANMVLVSGGAVSVDSLESGNAADILASCEAVNIDILPTAEVVSGDSIILEIDNGKFDERLVNSDPFIFRTENTGMTYDDLVKIEGNTSDIAAKYVKNEGSSKIPYGFNYIDSKTLEVYLYPIEDADVNTNTNFIAEGIPYYHIALPVTTEGSEKGEVVLSLDSNNTAITSGVYTLVNVMGNDDNTSESTTDVTEESTSEDTTSLEVTTSETDTETTTKRTSSGGGGGGSSSLKVSKTTSTTTTEATTEITTYAKESTTETTTESNDFSRVDIQIGQKSISVDNVDFETDGAAYIQAESNSTLVPIRFVAIALSGGDIDNADTADNIVWDAVSKTVTILAYDRIVEFNAGSNVMTVDGKAVNMDYGVKAEITDGRMYVPFRAIGEALGFDVQWNSETKTASYLK